MHAYARILYVYNFVLHILDSKEREGQPARRGTPTRATSTQKGIQNNANAFDVFRSRTPVFPVRGGNLYHYAILADMLTYILAVYNLYFNLYVHICTYVHIRAYTSI